ncbi:bacteriocin [Dictyobacter kobayashii]|uniref:Heterocycloanthracin/sonorensin family bacteriocin n=1 Tax=Dictyobacter kobayashii TaxID=2014872 RepID=A0A402ANF8_9CHLR|nr:bacteriocin [Dictyobacter kobayashii]GCE20731.1 hypothetical protein KDK_45310 [Dictyobacter kobayashii]
MNLANIFATLSARNEQDTLQPVALEQNKLELNETELQNINGGWGGHHYHHHHHRYYRYGYGYYYDDCGYGCGGCGSCGSCGGGCW